MISIKNTLVLYESYYGTTEKTAKAISYIVGNSKTVDINNAPDSIDKYSNIILCFPLFGLKTSEKTIKYLKKNNFNFEDKKLVIVCVGLSKKDCMKYVSNIQNLTKVSDIYYHFVLGELIINKLNDDDKNSIKNFLKFINMPFQDMGKFTMNNAIEVAINIKHYLEKPASKISKSQLKKSIDNFINENNTATLATGYDKFIRATPIEYIYKDDCFYFISEGGLKYVGILQNDNVSITIYESYTSMTNLKGLQIQGTCHLVDIYSKEYEEVINLKNINIEKIKEFPINLNMFKVLPNTYEFLNSDFKKLGNDAKQIYNCQDK